MEARTRKIYAAFDQRRKTVEAKEADRLDAEELRQLEEKIKRKKP